MLRFLFAIVLLTAWAGSARASSQHLDYELYAAGLDAVTASLDVREDTHDYRADLSARTRGILAKFVPWQGSFHAEGVRDEAGRLYPWLHVSTATGRKDTEVKTYRYDGNGGFVSYHIAVNRKDKTPKDLDKALADETIDALSAALSAMNAVAAGQPCDGRSEVFDGDRRYRLAFHDLGPDTIPVSHYGIYSGPAEKCSAEVTPLQGKWSAKPRGWLSIQEQGRKRGSLPTIWFANVDPGAPAVPVKIQVATDYGTLFMHVTAYHNDRKTGGAADKGGDHE